jgi:hypothetical protein
MRGTHSQSTTPLWLQIVALIFAALLLGFLIITYFKTPDRTSDQREIARFLSALLAGFAASFIGGKASLYADFPKTSAFKFTFSATAGVAIFILVYKLPPFWYEPPGQKQPAVQSSPSPISVLSASPVSSARVSRTPEPIATNETKTPPTETPLGKPNELQPGDAPASAPDATRKSGRVLLLVRDAIIVEALRQKLNQYGLQVKSEAEIGENYSEAIRRLHLGNPDAGAAIPFAVVITGKVSVTPRGFSGGTYVANASVTLTAIVTSDGEAIPEPEHAFSGGGGPSQDAAIQAALRQAGNDINQWFIGRIYERAR